MSELKSSWKLVSHGKFEEDRKMDKLDEVAKFGVESSKFTMPARSANAETTNSWASVWKGKGTDAVRKMKIDEIKTLQLK